VPFEFHSYKGCKHAFTNHSGPNYNKEAFDLSFKRLVEFFQKNLA
jgi:dienelactone hydrolase